MELFLTDKIVFSLILNQLEIFFKNAKHHASTYKTMEVWVFT